MINDKHFGTNAIREGISTQKIPTKGRDEPLSDVACLAETRLVCAVCTMIYELTVTIWRLVYRVKTVHKIPDIVFCDTGYSAYDVIECLHHKEISMFSTAKDFQKSTNNHVPFDFRNAKDGDTTLISHSVKIRSSTRAWWESQTRCTGITRQ